MTERTVHYRILRDKKDEQYWVQVRSTRKVIEYTTIPKWKPCWLFGLWYVRDEDEWAEQITTKTDYYNLGRYMVNESEGSMCYGDSSHWSFKTEYFDTIEDAQAAIDEQLEYEKIDNTYEGDWQP